MRTSDGILVMLALTLAACVGRREPAPAEAADPARGMSGMGAPMRGAQLMALMRPHLDSLGAMDAGQMAAAMPAHRDLAIRMMDAMGADMRGRSMRPDSAWSALSDSLRQDLGDLSTLRGAALRNRMQGHIGRMQRMMTVHQQMLGM